MKNKIIKILKEKNVQSLAGNMLTAGFGFLNFVILARTFDKDIFGEWVLYLTGAAFVEMFRFGITRTALIRFLAGAKEEDQKQLIGSNWLIGLVVSVFIAIVLYALLLIFPERIESSGFVLFFQWYPILAFLNLPFNNALTILQARQQFDKIFVVRFLNSGLFFFGLLVNFLWLHKGLLEVIWFHLIISFVVSLVTVLLNWDGILNIFHATKEKNKTILNFGKYTTITLIGTNLLKSADTFIIALSPLGVTAVALYSIPLKLTELLQIPLRSFVATAFPKMSKASIEGDLKMVRYYFYSYSGSITILFIPVTIITFFFSDFFVLLLGGEKYLGIDPVTGASASLIFKVFAIYGMLLPIDRLTGVGLDSINKPKKNFYKIIFMVVANIIGDLIAVFVFESLLAVAVVTIIFTLIGLIIGYYYLHKEIDLKFRLIFIEGWKVYSNKIKELL
ncbi:MULTISPECIES: oligosaccharide flippase family protein [unclassified Lentimicrobium]|uniref:oligosaccharide flippase family protein n=1 Tax=unclassified Lentimicrobium TaxID=2677434 RepID=UPI0015566285|nr:MULTISPECIES: oligosaccharide flippase family protein [unclassified Lentimicrobium]NPD46193.1 oligosaccharide flippase family protein [Lentimicrobium sp. S6]NPD83244.1 oligosaccharide flippase family protein [Lentimicrobium sp. L6]